MNCLRERQKIATVSGMDTKTLLESVLAGLQEHKGRWPDLARAAGVDYSWLTKLAQGRISDPGIQKIQRLADVLGQGKPAA